MEPYEIVVECSKVVSGISNIHYDENTKESMLSSRRCPHTYQVAGDDASALPDKSIGECFTTMSSVDIHQVPKLSLTETTSAITSTSGVESDKRSVSEKSYPSNEQSVVATDKKGKVPLVAYQDSHQLWSPSLLLEVDSPPTSPELNRHHSSRISTPNISSEMHNRSIDFPIPTTVPDPINAPNYTNSITKTVEPMVLDKENASATKSNHSLNQENFGNAKYSTPKQSSHNPQDNRLPSNDAISENVKQTSDDHVVIHQKISEGKPRKKTTSPVPFKKVRLVMCI